jgi:hypothetical protein
MGSQEAKPLHKWLLHMKIEAGKGANRHVYHVWCHTKCWYDTLPIAGMAPYHMLVVITM